MRIFWPRKIKNTYHIILETGGMFPKVHDYILKGSLWYHLGTGRRPGQIIEDQLSQHLKHHIAEGKIIENERTLCRKTSP
jgi:hypothetical protein